MYEVAVLQVGQEFEEWRRTLREHGASAAMDFLLDHVSRQPGGGSRTWREGTAPSVNENIYGRGGYVMSWSVDLTYVRLARATSAGA